MADRAIAADHRHALRSAGAEKCQHELSTLVAPAFRVEGCGLSWQAEKGPTVNSQPPSLNFSKWQSN